MINPNKRRYVDVHVLQNVPPSCVNRDDTGSPKTAVYGGTTRARVSSQAWKMAVRKLFMEHMAAEDVGVRTKYLHDMLAAAIAALDPNANADDLAEEKLVAAGIKLKAKDNSKKIPKITDALFFISPAQIDALAQKAIEGETKKKELEKALNEAPAIDVALFGRMVASNPLLNTDAACQVAHSISTHTVHNEYDYFTAVDDRSPEDNAGAGHMGTVEYNSSTLYRYATVNVSELKVSMGTQTAKAVVDFVDAFIRSMPTGKQNTFANRTLPDFVYVTIRTDQPINLVGAFERPVTAGSDGYMQHSVDAISRYAERVYESFADEPACAFVVTTAETTGALGKSTSRNAMLEALKAELETMLAHEVM